VVDEGPHVWWEECKQELARLVAGDMGALRTLYDRHQEPLAKFVYRHLGDKKAWIKAGGHEVCEDVWIQVAKTAHTFEGRSTVMTWLCAIAIRRCAKHVDAVLHANRRLAPKTLDQKAEIFEAVPDGEAPVPELAANSEFAQAVEAALKGLPVSQRTVFALRLQRGLSWGEVAQAMGIGISQAEYEWRLAAKALRPLLKQFTSEGKGGAL
jgi:RNA polymerase sigma factor (sigma-70 family)